MSTERDRLVEANLSLVQAIAHKLKGNLGKSLEKEDLVAYGSRGLIEAAERFDPTQGVSFTTFAYYRIRGAMLDGVRTMNWYSRGDYARFRAEERANEYLQANAERDAAETQQEGKPSESKATILASIAETLSSVATVHLVSMEAAEHVADESLPASDARLIDREAGQRVRAAIETLPEKEKRMLVAFYFEGKTLLDAGKEMGLSKSWACRLHARAIDLLRERLHEPDE